MKRPREHPASEHAECSEQRWQVAGLCLALAAITFAVFGQTLTHGFVDYDDSDYVYGNPVVIRGLTLQGIAWAFTAMYAYNWHPVTWLSHELDCQLYGLHPGGHHLTNVLLHTATVIVLFLVLRQMTGALWRSAFVAAVFAIHPLRVESVAWVAERKDVLSGLFFMLTIGAYVRYANEREATFGRVRLRRTPDRSSHGSTESGPTLSKHRSERFFYCLALFFFALGLLSKPMLVTLPLVLLLLDYWPLQRVESAGRLVLEKLPLLALSAVSCAATLLAQQENIQLAGSFSMPDRLANALAAVMIYLRQMVWPAGLAVLYPYPRNGLPRWEVVLAGTLLAGLLALAFWRRRKQPWLLMGLLWYLVMLLPVVGIIQVGDQAHADRYTYLPLIGIYVAVTWLMAEWGAKRQANRAAMRGLMAVVIGALMVCAWKQAAYWKSGEILWAHTLACTADNDVAHFNLGNALRDKGKMGEAITQFQQALQINPDYAQAHDNLGNLFREEGRLDDAIAHFQKALQINPDNTKAHNNLGYTLLQKGMVDEAIAQFQQALEIDPNNTKARVNLEQALLQKGHMNRK